MKAIFAFNLLKVLKFREMKWASGRIFVNEDDGEEEEEEEEEDKRKRGESILSQEAGNQS